MAARWAVGITPWGEGNAHGTTRHDARLVQGSNIGVLFWLPVRLFCDRIPNNNNLPSTAPWCLPSCRCWRSWRSCCLGASYPGPACGSETDQAERIVIIEDGARYKKWRLFKLKLIFSLTCTWKQRFWYRNINCITNRFISIKSYNQIITQNMLKETEDHYCSSHDTCITNETLSSLLSGRVSVSDPLLLKLPQCNSPRSLPFHHNSL